MGRGARVRTQHECTGLLRERSSRHPRGPRNTPAGRAAIAQADDRPVAVEETRMSDLPPRQRLGQLLRSMSKHLPGQLDGLLENARFTDGAAALQRLADPTHLEKALARMSLEEAGWLADVLTERWSWLGDLQLEPEV